MTLPILASEGDCFAFLAGLEGAKLQGCLTDLPYDTLERHRARGTTTRLTASTKSDNPWFGTLSTTKLCRALEGIYKALDKNAYAFVYVDSSSALLLAHELGVAPALLNLVNRPTSEAPRDSIGWGWWTPALWVKTAVDRTGDGPVKLQGGMGYHGVACHETILILEKGKSQLRERFLNVFLSPRPPRKPKGATLRGATAKPVEVATILTRAMAAPGGRILDPFVGVGTHAEGILRAGCQPIVNDIDLAGFRDWMCNVFKREWLEPIDGEWRPAADPTRAVESKNG
jgi:site-specific DNA-methyltransferase (adenine-specific)